MDALARGTTECFQYAMRELEAGNDRRLHAEMRKAVCRYFWWMTGEFFILEGDLGWGPGHREYDGDAPFPPRVCGYWRNVDAFLHDLGCLRRSRAVEALAGARWDRANTSVEARTLRFLYARLRTDAEVLNYLYERLATSRSEYEVGAARVFMGLVKDDPSMAPLACAGLALLLAKQLRRVSVRKEVALARRQARAATQPKELLFVQCVA